MDAATQNTMNLLRNMRVFVRVAEAGSFTAGAEQSDVTTAQASALFPIWKSICMLSCSIGRPGVSSGPMRATDIYVAARRSSR